MVEAEALAPAPLELVTPDTASAAFSASSARVAKLGRIGLERIERVEERRLAGLQEIRRREAGVRVLRRLARHCEAPLDQHAQRFRGQIGRGDSCRSLRRRTVSGRSARPLSG